MRFLLNWIHDYVCQESNLAHRKCRSFIATSGLIANLIATIECDWFYLSVSDWWSLPDLNWCYKNENLVSWTGLDEGTIFLGVLIIHDPKPIGKKVEYSIYIYYILVTVFNVSQDPRNGIFSIPL